MKVTIVKDDNLVLVDGVPYAVDCSGLGTTVHAVQWDGASGHVEHAATRCEHCGARTKKGNEILSNFDAHQTYVDAWTAAKVKAEEEAAAAKVKADEEKAEREKQAAEQIVSDREARRAEVAAAVAQALETQNNASRSEG